MSLYNSEFMSKKAVTILLGCLIVLLLQSCRPEGVLSREKMGQVLFDVHLTEAMLKPSNNQSIDRWSNGLDRESFIDLTYRSVLKKHGLTPEQFDMNVRWYSRHLNSYEKVYKDVLEKLAEYKMQTQKRIDLSRTSSQGLSSLSKSLWQIRPAFLNAVLKPDCQYVPDSVRRYNQMQFGFKQAETKPVFRLVPNAVVNNYVQPSDSVTEVADQLPPEVIDQKQVLDESKKEEGPHFVDFKPESRASRLKKKTNEDPKISERFKKRVEAAKKQKESLSK